MKIKTAPQFAAVVLALAMVPSFAMAQNAGFRTGIAQATFGFPPTQAPATVTRSTFVGTPVIVTPPPPVQVFVPAQIVFISNQIPIPGQTIVPVQPPITARPQTPGAPVAGTPRHEVLRIFGQPNLIVSTSTCETMYFNNGVTVIIQNDKVAGPR